MATVAVCLFVLVVLRSFTSFSESTVSIFGGSSHNPGVFSSLPFSAGSDTDIVAQDTVKHDTVPPPAALTPPPSDSLADEETNAADTLDEQPEDSDSTEIYGDTTETGDGAVIDDSTEEPEHDSLDVVADTLHSDSTKSDSSYVVFLDSTWRMKQHLHHRSDDVSVRTFPRSTPSLYLPINSPAYQRSVTLDSTGRFVLLRETVNGLDVKVPVKMPLDEYVSRRLEFEERNNWRTMTQQYNITDKGDGLSNLFSSFTKIEIPVPPNPIFSIFGKNKISLHITGAVDIRAGFKNITSDIQTLSSLDQSRNEPDFNQDVSIAVDGSVGDKLKIGADWNTQRTFEYENSLKIRYEGYEDEIIKSVEAGNVSLSVPSFIGSSQALFGIKTQMQFGPLNVTALVSQKKGSAKEVTLSGGAKTSGSDIPITRYSKAHYFLDVVYRPIFETFHKELPSRYNQDLAISEIEVWKSVKTQQITGRRDVRAYYELPSRTDKADLYSEATLNALDADSASGSKEVTGFIRLEEGKDYKVHREEGYISFSSAPADEEVIAVAYGTVGGDYFGEFAGIGSAMDTSRALILKLIKPQYLRENHKAWDLMLKNIYSLGARDIKEKGLDLKIIYKPVGTSDMEEVNGLRLLTLLRLDRYKSGSGVGADNNFDFLSGFTIDPERGELIFPDLRPFDSTLAQEFRNNNFFAYDSLLIHEIYDKKLSLLDESASQNNIYAIRPSIAGAVSARISLNSFNIVEGSVQVLFNGSPLTPGVDYDVNYIIGEVNIRKEEALVPGANVQIKYEQNDLFQIASKTLMGARGELYVGRDSKLGFTIMNLNQETLSDKVRLGEEPTNNTILGIDGATQYNLPFLTSALDAIPGLSARDMSSIRLSGEAAYILPDPNTKRSTILGDNGASIAYIDDFEGTRRIVPLNVNYTSWKPASPPVYTLLPNSPSDVSKTFSKAKLAWYNNSQRNEAVSVHEIWPFKSVRRGEELVPLLIMDYNPLKRGMYNYSLNIDSTLLIRPDRNWNGIQRYIASTAGDLIQQNLNYLELWVKASSTDSIDLRNGRLFIDIGKISEDVIPDGKLNSEDYVRTAINPTGVPNGIYNPGEDLGLDTLNDDGERAKFADFIAAYPDMAGDPSGDNFDYTTESSNFDRINGVEGNNERNAVDSRVPDTEDLNSNATTDVTNYYIEYEVPLTDSLPSGEANRYIVGGGTNKWYQIRIPLLDTTRVTGSEPALNILQNVQYIRFWLSGFSSPMKLRIAEINFVGNQWIEAMKDDSVLKASVVNVEDNPNYTIPPGVIRERDRTQPDQEVYGNEQSLAMLIKGLRAGESRQVVKFFGQRAVDMFSYRALKLFVHGDQSFGEDAEIFLRFGADTLNYYEYSQPLKPDWDEMNVIFTELTSVKAARDSGATTSKIPAPSGPAGSYYSLRGNPALTKVQYIGIGVRNVSSDYPVKTRYTDPPRDLEGEVWVNEMRVVDVDNTAGGAYRFDTQLKLSDFGNVSFNYSYTDPNFHSVDRAFGDRITRKSWAVNTNFALDHFLPQDWQGASIPIAYSHSENIALPKYLPNTDVVVDEAARRASERASNATPEERQRAADAIVTQSQTVNIKDNYSISNFKFGLPWQAWYIKDIINSLSFRFNYSSSSDRDPTLISRTSWIWNFGMTYGVNLNHGLYLQPFTSLFEDIPILDDYKDWKLYLFPVTNFNTSLDGSRSHSYELSRAYNATARETRTFSANKQLQFGWKITEGGLLGIGGDYGISVRRDLLYLDTAGNRGFSDILRALFLGGRDGAYGQSVSFNTRPRIPNILDITKYLDQISAGYKVSYGWQNAFLKGDAGKAAQWDNTINAGFSFKLKSLADSWFKDEDEPQRGMKPKPTRVPPREPPPGTPDSLKSQFRDSTEVEDTSGSFSPFEKLKTAAKILIKYPLLDYENINISFVQSNRSTNTAVVGGTGFQNFWGVLPFQDPKVGAGGGGPSRMYQLGLVSDPSSTLRFSSRFPFFERVAYRGADGWLPNTYGVRATGATPTDDFTQKNDISLKTNRPLWEGATLDIDWKVGWQYHRRTTLTIDTLYGLPISGTTQTNGSIERSFISLPPVLLFKVLKSNLEDVGKKYDENIKKEEYANRQGAAAADAFERGMEALPFMNKFFGQFVPRPNWSLRWGGIERVVGIGSWVQSLSLDHSYRSSFRRDFNFDKDGVEQTSVERISYDFSPLIGVNTTFKELFKGNFTGSFQYKTSTAYDLSITNLRITEDLTREISLSLTYSRRGFEFPLFGLNLKNDLEFSFTFSSAKKSRRQHDPTFLQSNQEGTPLDGNIRTTMEPRIRYTLSSRVTASLFYRYLRTEPDAGGSTIPGTTTNEAGVDIHISIQ